MQHKILSSTNILQQDNTRVVQHTIQLPSGAQRQKMAIQHPGAVAIVPFIDDEHIVLIRQYRLALDDTLLEIPAGTLEPGEDPRTCALRELQEEAGYAAGEMTPLGSIIIAPGMSDEVIHLFVARDLTPSQLPQDEDELIEPVVLPFADVLKMTNSGEIRDAKTLLGLLRVSKLA